MPEPLGESHRLQCVGGPLPPFLHLHTEGYEGGLHVFLGGERGNQVEALKDESDVLAAYFGELRLGQFGHVRAVEFDTALGGGSRPPSIWRRVDFPPPVGPWMTSRSPSAMVRSTPASASTVSLPRV